MLLSHSPPQDFGVYRVQHKNEKNNLPRFFPFLQRPEKRLKRTLSRKLPNSESATRFLELSEKQILQVMIEIIPNKYTILIVLSMYTRLNTLSLFNGYRLPPPPITLSLSSQRKSTTIWTIGQGEPPAVCNLPLACLALSPRKLGFSKYSILVVPNTNARPVKLSAQNNTGNVCGGKISHSGHAPSQRVVWTYAAVRFRTRVMPHLRASYGRMYDLSVATLTGRAHLPKSIGLKIHNSKKPRAFSSTRSLIHTYHPLSCALSLSASYEPYILQGVLHVRFAAPLCIHAPMCPYVPLCTPVYPCVHPCIIVYPCVVCTPVYPCVPLCTSVPLYHCVPLFTPAYPCVPLPMCTPVYPRVPLCTPAYPCVPLCTPVYPCVPLCTPAYPCVHPCTPVYHCVLYHCLPLFTPVYPCVPLCTPVYPGAGYLFVQ